MLLLYSASMCVCVACTGYIQHKIVKACLLCSDCIPCPCIAHWDCLLCLLSRLSDHTCFVCIGVYVIPSLSECLCHSGIFCSPSLRQSNRGLLLNFNCNNRVSCVSIVYYNMNHRSMPAHLSCFCLPCVLTSKHWKWWWSLPRKGHVFARRL